ncbi:MAG: hypothetical protein K8S13_04580 [Desulfobacula sp.]|uniref:hypothetical protein n=1 Tax=Desulfobacula sp. TaxID=2593537 RepID=UPI0025BD0E3A|nr:hypothetical protein [Desulfobacula sp.]MCD4719121.1 hypothetical protein [Desulfobacula sp.]
MKFKMTILLGITILVLTGCVTTPLKMPPPSTLNITNINQHPYTAGLFVPQSLKEYVYVKVTSPLDKMSFPLGEQTNEVFKKNMPLVFKNVVEINSITPGRDVDLIIKPSIIKFNSIIPQPAYKPYIATMIYHVDVYNKKGEKIYAQTSTGEAQTSKGLLSGFSARSICAEVAQMAMGNSVQQIVEGLSEADELKNLK